MVIDGHVARPGDPIGVRDAHREAHHARGHLLVHQVARTLQRDEPLVGKDPRGAQRRMAREG